MTTLASHLAPRGSAARDLVAVWLTVTAVLTYLDVPLRHSPLIASNLVLQASLGTFIITHLVKGVVPSLLVLCGPGLILGGALSFGTFQVAGRGSVGIFLATIAGLTALIAICRSWRSEASNGQRWWILSQLVGVAGLGVSHEFSEAAPLAIVMFVGGLGVWRPTSLRRRAGHTLFMVGALAIIVFQTLRDDYWWLITDDYQLFEVIARHVAQNGPLGDWGVTSYARYHWLSYGWAGQLDVLSGVSEPFVTLTRVMPFVYSLALAASLALISTVFHEARPTSTSIAQVWAVVAILRLDWSGTSTAGSYAVLAVVVYLILRKSPQPIAAHSRKIQVGPYVTIGLLVCVLALTKVTSIFPLVLLLGPRIVHSKFMGKLGVTPTRLFRVAVQPFLMAVGLVLIWIAGKLLNGSYRFVSINPQIGQLAWFGPWFAGAALVLQQFWLWIVSLIVIQVLPKSRGGAPPNRCYWTGWIPFVALLSGVILDVTITANADNHRYLSGPFYFVAAISFLVPKLPESATTCHSGILSRFSPLVTATVASGLLWSVGGVGQRAVDAASLFVVGQNTLVAELIKFVSNDSRFGATLTCLILAVIGRFRHLALLASLKALIISLVLLTLAHSGLESDWRFTSAPSSEEIVTYIGSVQERAVGEWLRENTPAESLIATNRVFGKFGGRTSNMGLAVWSRREFLVLGPSLSDTLTSRRSQAIVLSVEFGKGASSENCRELHRNGVTWFVVDTSLTNARNWSLCANPVFANGQLVVLALD